MHRQGTVVQLIFVAFVTAFVLGVILGVLIQVIGVPGVY